MGLKMAADEQSDRLTTREEDIAADLELAATLTAKRDASRRQLDAITDPLVRKILDLHRRDEYGDCCGCDHEGPAEYDASWPCRTVLLIAEHHGIDGEWLD